jgi:hypothetical protein
MNLDDLIPQVALEAQDVPEFTASMQLVLSARELCTFSLAWQDDVTVNLNGKATYSFLPQDGELVEPISATFTESQTGSTSRVQFTTPARLDQEDPSWRTRVGNALWAFFPDQETVQYVPNPPQGTIITRVALQPTMTDRTVDDRVGNLFSETIVHGALARLFRMPNRQWSDKGMAAYYQELFERGKGEAQVRGVDGFAKVNRRVRYGGL